MSTIKSVPSSRLAMGSAQATARLAEKASRRRVADEAKANTPLKSARRKRNHTPVELVDLTDEGMHAFPAKKPKSVKKTKTSDEPAPERRARVFRNHPPKTYLDRVARARSQRMYVVQHTVSSAHNALEMKFDLVGTTGNLYKTTIGKVPECDCPDGRKGNQCKHICYVLAIVLKAPEHLQYQLAFLSTELDEIYQGSSLSREQAKSEDNDGKRKAIEGDCPICFMEFEPANEEIVWCQSACGNNIHKACFDQWAATQRSQGVRCVYCRSPWQADTSNLSMGNLTKVGRVNYEGYVNVASQLGLSGERDYSTYHPFWVAQQFGRRYHDHDGDEFYDYDD